MTHRCCDPGDAAAFIDEVRAAPARRHELVPLLAEQSPIYDGLTSREADRLRGYIFASFEGVGLPDEALPFVLEELTLGSDPYPVAAAVRALRGAASLPETVFPLLSKAIARVAGNDDRVQYESFQADASDDSARTTALADMFQSVSALGPRAAQLRDALHAMAERPDAYAPEVLMTIKEALRAISAAPVSGSCCCGPISPAAVPSAVGAEPSSLDELALQDQNGENFLYREFFGGWPSVITFFYTRCMNAEKCSLTISKLARLQRLIRAEEGLRGHVNIAAFTYDPAFDTPERLHAYGLVRSMIFDRRSKFIRTCGAFQPVQRHFDLGVGFGPATVNRHRIELLIVDGSGRTQETFSRVQWTEHDVLRGLVGIAQSQRLGE